MPRVLARRGDCQRCSTRARENRLVPETSGVQWVIRENQFRNRSWVGQALAENCEADGIVGPWPQSLKRSRARIVYRSLPSSSIRTPSPELAPTPVIADIVT